ncbi:MAG: 50S ribosomal protein L4 [Deltaproteobacteria bacterium]|nr:50S ribosomal protein L4 [Deltaproteobacteria bacterium]
MPTVDIYNQKNEKVGTLDLSEEVFGQELRKDLIWEVVKCQQARMRQGNSSTKTRAEVSGTGAKPFRQKGTGRARQGTKRSPSMRGGGVAFGPKPRSYSYTVPKQVRRRALCSALSNQARENMLRVMQDLTLDSIKTKPVAEMLKALGVKKALVVDVKENQNLKLSARNLRNATFRPAEGINLVDLLRYQNLVISEAAIKQLEGELKK